MSPRKTFREFRSRWVATRPRSFMEAFLAKDIPSLSGTVVDLGGGRTAPHDSSWAHNVWRLRVDILERHSPDVVGDAMRLPFSTGSIDAVVASQLLEHVPNPSAAIAEVHRVLRPGGVLLGAVPFMFPIHGDPHDYFRFTRDGLQVLLHDFATVTIQPHGNTKGAAFTLLASKSRVIRAFSPIARSIWKEADDSCPEGYQFRAVKD